MWMLTISALPIVAAVNQMVIALSRRAQRTNPIFMSSSHPNCRVAGQDDGIHAASDCHASPDRISHLFPVDAGIRCGWLSSSAAQ